MSSNESGFIFYDVAQVSLLYTEVKKTKDGYGSYNSLQRTHTARTKAIVITVIVVGGLALLIGAAIAAK